LDVKFLSSIGYELEVAGPARQIIYWVCT
jgi:hypothetical protein